MTESIRMTLTASGAHVVVRRLDRQWERPDPNPFPRIDLFAPRGPADVFWWLLYPLSEARHRTGAAWDMLRHGLQEDGYR